MDVRTRRRRYEATFRTLSKEQRAKENGLALLFILRRFFGIDPLRNSRSINARHRRDKGKELA